MACGDVPGGWVPFASRPLIHATSSEQMAEALGRFHGVRSSTFAQGDGAFLGVTNQLQLDGVRFQYCRYDTPTQIRFTALDGYRQMFVLSGSKQIASGGATMAIDETSTGVIPPNADFATSYSEGYAHIVVEFDAAGLARKAELIFGRGFESLPGSVFMRSLPVERFWKTRNLVLNLAHHFSSDADERSLVVAELAQTLKSAFLLEHLVGAQGPLERAPQAAGDSAASRLEDYIQDNWNKPLSVEGIAAACGVSVRSVFARFRQRRGVSPMAYLREVRLDQARRLLLEGGAGTSVIDVAMACGFASFGHFARRYRDRFGELPSATISRTRSAQT